MFYKNWIVEAQSTDAFHARALMVFDMCKRLRKGQLFFNFLRRLNVKIIDEPIKQSINQNTIKKESLYV